MAAAVLHPLDPADLASLGRACGIPLTAYRRGHVQTCVGRTLIRCGVPGVPELIRLCWRDGPARAALLRCLLVPTTGLFRDPEQFAVLSRDILPGLVCAPRGVRVSWPAAPTAPSCTASRCCWTGWAWRPGASCSARTSWPSG